MTERITLALSTGIDLTLPLDDLPSLDRLRVSGVSVSHNGLSPETEVHFDGGTSATAWGSHGEDIETSHHGGALDMTDDIQAYLAALHERVTASLDELTRGLLTPEVERAIADIASGQVAPYVDAACIVITGGEDSRRARLAGLIPDLEAEVLEAGYDKHSPEFQAIATLQQGLGL